jgi:hypothetical protein
MKGRRKGRVISVTRHLVYGSLEIVKRIMAQSVGRVKVHYRINILRQILPVPISRFPSVINIQFA